MLQPEARHFLAGVEYATEAPDQDLFPGKGWAWELYVTYSEALGNAYYVVGSEAVSSSIPQSLQMHCFFHRRDPKWSND